MARNAKLADRVFELIPAKKRMLVEEVLQELYANPVSKEFAENPPVSPKMFIGWVYILYFHQPCIILLLFTPLPAQNSNFL